MVVPATPSVAPPAAPATPAAPVQAQPVPSAPWPTSSYAEPQESDIQEPGFAPVISASTVITPTPAPPVVPVTPNVYVQQMPPPAPVIPAQFKLTPEINVDYSKNYRLQIGSYRIARNAVETFEKLKNAGLNPAYEKYEASGSGEYFRVVLAGISGADVNDVTEKLRLAGFREALIRLEN
jgi:rare lipoprotein A